MFEGLVREVADYRGDLMRNIKGIRVSQDLFDDLGGRSRPTGCRHRRGKRYPHPEPRAAHHPAVRLRHGDHHLAPHNWHATRYSDGLEYGVWYGALEIETTVYETLYHWRRFIQTAIPISTAK